MNTIVLSLQFRLPLYDLVEVLHDCYMHETNNAQYILCGRCVFDFFFSSFVIECKSPEHFLVILFLSFVNKR